MPPFFSHRLRISLPAVLLLLAGCGGPAETQSPAPSSAETSPPPPVEGMVWIPGGSFLMGAFTGMPNEAPVHSVRLDGFYLDETEVTNAQFHKFIDATKYVTFAERPMPDGSGTYGSILFKKTDGPVPLDSMAWWTVEPKANWRQPNGPGSNLEGRDNHPVVCVTWEDATAYAKWGGKRLPTEAEWEFAARGGQEGKKYEWGNQPLPNEKESKPDEWPCNIWQGNFPYEDWATDGYSGTSPVKSYKPNGYRLYDMTGNVWEHCHDWLGANYYAESRVEGKDTLNPRGPGEPQAGQGGTPVHVIRGASWRIHRSYGPSPGQGMPPILEYRVTTRNEAAIDSPTNDVGFRCAKDR